MNLKDLKKVINLFETSELTELKIEEKELSLTMKKGGTFVPAMTAPQQPIPVAQQIPLEFTAPERHPHISAMVDDHLKIVEAPMIGTFYRSPSPTSNPYVNIGDHVSKGQTLCIIEAMKLMNEIESPFDGKIVKILAENGKTVEYGTPLYHIDPA